jgi:hypothetical protein
VRDGWSAIGLLCFPAHMGLRYFNSYWLSIIGIGTCSLSHCTLDGSAEEHCHLIGNG